MDNNILNILREGMGESFLVKQGLTSKTRDYKSYYESRVALKEGIVECKGESLRTTINSVISFTAYGEDTPSALPAPAAPAPKKQTLGDKFANSKFGQKMKEQSDAMKNKAGELNEKFKNSKVGQNIDKAIKYIMELIAKIKKFIIKTWKNLTTRKTHIEKLRAKIKKISERLKKQIANEKNKKIKIPRVLIDFDIDSLFPMLDEIMPRLAELGAALAEGKAIHKKADVEELYKFTKLIKDLDYYRRDNSPESEKLKTEVDFRKALFILQKWDKALYALNVKYERMDEIKNKVEQAIKTAEEDFKNRFPGEKKGEMQGSAQVLIHCWQATFNSIVTLTKIFSGILITVDESLNQINVYIRDGEGPDYKFKKTTNIPKEKKYTTQKQAKKEKPKKEKKK